MRFSAPCGSASPRAAPRAPGGSPSGRRERRRRPRSGDALNLVRSYLDPRLRARGATIGDRGWTYDSAVTAAGVRRHRPRPPRAEPILDDLAALQQPDGALGFSYDVRTGSADMLARSGAIAWVGIAAAQYRTSTCSPRYDGLIAGVARWLLAHRIADPASPGYGFVPGRARRELDLRRAQLRGARLLRAAGGAHPRHGRHLRRRPCRAGAGRGGPARRRLHRRGRRRRRHRARAVRPRGSAPRPPQPGRRRRRAADRRAGARHRCG